MVSFASAGQSELNLTAMPRSAGSTLKPFLYAEAIDRRTLTAASLLPDTAESIRGIYTDYDPRNFNHRFLGPVRVREALANSLNVPAVIALSDLGARGTFVDLLSWGLGFRHGFDTYGAGFILGNAEVSLLDLAGAYAALARSGVAWDPVFFPGEPAQPRRVVSPAAAAIITDILCDNDARRSSFGNASPLDVGCRVAVKTGTSSAFRDGWCLGFTSEHTIGVWVGNPDGSPMNAALAVSSAAPIWNVLVHALLSRGDTPLPEIQESETIECHRVCRQTGLLPRDGEPTVREWFLTGTAPVRHSREMYRGKTLVLPPAYASWCASAQNRLGAVTESGPLEITFPRDGAVFAINPHLPLTQQTLRPLSTNSHCEWLLNGEKLPPSGVMLQRGNHCLTARLGSEVRTASFRVE
jgi:penicillin-binding protein 1C